MPLKYFLPIPFSIPMHCLDLGRHLSYPPTPGAPGGLWALLYCSSVACLSVLVLKHGSRDYVHLAGLGAGLLDFWKVPQHHPALAAFAFWTGNLGP